MRKRNDKSAHSKNRKLNKSIESIDFGKLKGHSKTKRNEDCMLPETEIRDTEKLATNATKRTKSSIKFNKSFKQNTEMKKSIEKLKTLKLNTMIDIGDISMRSYTPINNGTGYNNNTQSTQNRKLQCRSFIESTEDLELQNNCTFKPTLNDKSIAIHSKRNASRSDERVKLNNKISGSSELTDKDKIVCKSQQSGRISTTTKCSEEPTVQQSLTQSPKETLKLDLTVITILTISILIPNRQEASPS